MAPEQLEGKDADHRTDIFAFGAVVYEMATGQRAFSGESQASLIGAILKDDPPPMSTLQPMTPSALGYVVKTCLAKDPDDRWQSAGDIARQVKGISESGSQPSVAAWGVATPQPVTWRRAAMPWVATLTLAGVTGLAVWVLTPSAPSPAQPLEFVIPLAAGDRFTDVTKPLVALSPDGRQVVYVAYSAEVEHGFRGS